MKIVYHCSSSCKDTTLNNIVGTTVNLRKHSYVTLKIENCVTD